MAIIKCKMCGGDLNIEEGASVAECEYCGSRQTVPNQDNEKKLTLFGRANRLRLACEFDKAAGVYESIVADFPEEAEAYWGLVLCRYGIEYVDDPRTGKKIPTCHRSSFDSVMEDQDFEQACENADAVARKVYREEAKAIEELRRGILKVSGKEAPYDIFICYKETDDNGDRTIDSVIAQDVYDALTEKGYRVFFSRISLEDKLGTEYEPYIFAALNSAKIMLVFGTDYEYFNAVWVKNEWSRFLALIAGGQKKVLIPCYKNVDAYDMPKEFARLQAQDMGKVGAIQDLLRGIEKIIQKPGAATVNTTVQVTTGGPTVNSLLKRGFIALEDEEWKKAGEIFEEVLRQQPECGEAYLGNVLAVLKAHNLDEYYKMIMLCREEGVSFESKNYLRAKQYATGELKAWFDNLDRVIASEEQQKAEESRQRAIRLEDIRKESHKVNHAGLIKSGLNHTVGLKPDGTVLATGNNNYGQCNVQHWRNIIAVECGENCTIGLKSNGTVVATGCNEHGECNTEDWSDIVSICCKGYTTMGLRSNGMVEITGISAADKLRDVRDWRNIANIYIQSNTCVFGLTRQGTVLTVGGDFLIDTRTKTQTVRKFNVSNWTDIVDIECSYSGIVGRRADGTFEIGTTGDYRVFNEAVQKNFVDVTPVGGIVIGLQADGVPVESNPRYNEPPIKKWNNIVSIAGDTECVFGITSENKVVFSIHKDSYNSNNIPQIYERYKGVMDWWDIVALHCGFNHIVGIRSNGMIVATGDNKYGQCNVSGWQLFRNSITMEQELKDGRSKAEKELREKQEALEKKIQSVEEEVKNLKGIFSARRRKELENELDYLRNELNNLN